MPHLPKHPEDSPDDRTDDPRTEERRISISGPAALAAALRYLVDESPRPRLVVAVLTRHGQLRALMHRPLVQGPVPDDGSLPLDGELGDLAATVEGMIGEVCFDEEERAVAVVNLPSPDWLVGFRGPVFDEIRPGPTNLMDLLVVAGSRWRSLLCTEPICCPPAGNEMLADERAIAAVTELMEVQFLGGDALSGPVPRPAPIEVPSALSVDAALSARQMPTDLPARRDLLATVWSVVSDLPLQLTAEEAAACIMAADRPGVRDALLCRMAEEVDSPETWGRHGGIWAAVADSTPIGWAAGPRCLQAICAWALDWPSEALDVLSLALADQPDHRMAHLLVQLIQDGAAAERWFGSMRRLDESDCLRFDRPPPPRAPRTGSDLGEGPGLRDAG